MSERYYKVLGPDRIPYHGGYGQWPEAGEWRAVSGDLDPYSNGLHYCTLRQLPDWLGPHIWGFEPDGDVIVDGSKCVARRGRLTHEYTTWTARTARLFAADCAEHVLSLFETRYPDDLRPRQAIVAARGYATGDASHARMMMAADAAAAADAVRSAAAADAAANAADAAWSAAAFAALSASASAPDAAADAAWFAARSAAAAADAAWSAAAANAALFANAAANAAWSAAAFAALSASASATDAAADAAAFAALPAAASFASAAERDWQAERLRQYLDGEVWA